jgi:hypothetical protein
MRRSLSVAGAFVLGAALVAGIATATAATLHRSPQAAKDVSTGFRSFTAQMSGTVEVPPGDTDANGTALIGTNSSEGVLCAKVTVGNVDTIVAQHIHKAAAGVAGPVVIPLPATTASGANQVINGCVAADTALLADIEANPQNYYVNVHNAAFPGGAARGQLTAVAAQTVTQTVTRTVTKTKTKTRIVKVCPKKKKGK